MHQFPTLDDVYEQGCWIECVDCTTSYHYGCLPADMRKDIARQHKQERAAIIAKVEIERSARLASKVDVDGQQAQDNAADSSDETEIPPDKIEQDPSVKLSIKCPRCIKPQGGLCMICGEGSNSVKQANNSKATSPAQGM